MLRAFIVWIVGLLLLGALFLGSLALWNRAPPTKGASTWLAGPDAAVLLYALADRPVLAVPPQNPEAFRPPVVAFDLAIWDGLGLLYPVDKGERIYVPASGTVLFYRTVPDVGSVIMIRHPQNRISVFVGVAVDLLKETSPLRGGDVLGKAETGQGVFYMIRQNGNVVDPRKMFDTVVSDP